MPLVDSLDKVLGRYVAAFAATEYTYGDTTLYPKPLKVSQAVRQGFTCPAGCGGCCRNWTLDWLPDEAKPAGCEVRQVEANGVTKPIWSIMPKPGGISEPCRNLRQEDGRCSIHGKHPFSCDFELTRIIGDDRGWYVTTRLFSRGWSMNRTDGGKGAKCEMLPVTPEHAADTLRKFRALKAWSDYFEVDSRLPEVIAWLESIGHGPSADLVLHPRGSAVQTRMAIG